MVINRDNYLQTMNTIDFYINLLLLNANLVSFKMMMVISAFKQGAAYLISQLSIISKQFSVFSDLFFSIFG